jgi:hypothetical protein
MAPAWAEGEENRGQCKVLAPASDQALDQVMAFPVLYTGPDPEALLELEPVLVSRRAIPSANHREEGVPHFAPRGRPNSGDCILRRRRDLARLPSQQDRSLSIFRAKEHSILTDDS